MTDLPIDSPAAMDSARAGARDVVEIIGEAKVRVPALSLEQIFDPLQHFERQHAANAAAIDREKLFGALPLDPRCEAHGLSSLGLR